MFDKLKLIKRRASNPRALMNKRGRARDGKETERKVKRQRKETEGGEEVAER